MAQDIEPTIEVSKEHSIRYLHIMVRNVAGILNRLTSLMRRKRYNLEEVSVSFDDQDYAHMMFAVDGELHDIALMMEQLRKIHDVRMVEDATSQKDRFFNTFYVQADEDAELDGLPGKLLEKLNRDGHVVGIFIVNLDESPAFASLAKERGLHFRRRIVTLL